MVPFYRTLRLFKRHKDNPKTCTFQVTCSHTNSAFFPNPSSPISLRLQQFLFFLSSLGVKGFSTKALSSLGFCVYWHYRLRQKLWCSYQDCSPVCLYGYHPLQQPPAQQICVCQYHLLVCKTKIRQTLVKVKNYTGMWGVILFTNFLDINSSPAFYRLLNRQFITLFRLAL